MNRLQNINSQFAAPKAAETNFVEPQDQMVEQSESVLAWPELRRIKSEEKLNH